jgi:hypothetical protein
VETQPSALAVQPSMLADLADLADLTDLTDLADLTDLTDRREGNEIQLDHI